MDVFENKMKELLGDEFPVFLKLMDEPAFKGMRFNTLKCDKEKLFTKFSFNLKQTPFCKDGYYIDSDVEHMGSHPLHHAGAVYMQEPSAMSAVTMLSVQEGDRVLDLCAAPGSKTTQIAQALNGTGLLWSNEIVRNRASILVSNLERMGVRNAVVSSISPEVLCPALVGFFDKVLVDAPCSGEGMFRKDKDARNEWSAEHVVSCANRQLMILESAKCALKAGGVLVYSTCTYSVEENEGVVTRFLENNPEFELVDSGEVFGRNTLNYAKRIFPMDGGEGHFAAKFVKKYHPENEVLIEKNVKKNKKGNVKSVFEIAKKDAYSFIAEIFDKDEYKNLYTIGDKVYALTDEQVELLEYNIDFRKLAVIKTGVEVLSSVRNRYEPCHNAFTACHKDKAKNICDLDINDKRLYKFLHGEEIELTDDIKGYTLVCAEGVPLSFGKAHNKVLKNKYPKGLRNNG